MIEVKELATKKPKKMKQTLFIIAITFISFTTSAKENSDTFTCYSDRKVEISSTKGKTPEPWDEVDIRVVFNYDKKQLYIYAKKTLTLQIKTVGLHYEYEDTGSAVDMHAIDHEGREVNCTFVVFRDNRGGMVERLVVRYLNGELHYKMKRRV